MKIIWHEKPGGAMWRFKEYRFEDMVPMQLIRSMCKEDRYKICNPANTGWRVKQTATAVYSGICKRFWKKVVDRMMESEIFWIDKDTSMYIGRVEHDKNVLKGNNILHLSNTHGIILNGFFHDYYFRMPYRRRKELRMRVKKGQSFIV